MEKLYLKVLVPLNIVYFSEAVGGMVSVSGNREAFFQFPIVFVIQL
jgi:hypothetical protein